MTRYWLKVGFMAYSALHEPELISWQNNEDG
jgi:hypothetical protein